MNSTIKLLFISLSLILTSCSGGELDNCVTKYREETNTETVTNEQQLEYSSNFFNEDTSTCNSHLRTGTPKGSDQILCRDGFAIGYNYQYKVANWVSYKVTEESVNEYFPRSDDFQPDSEIPSIYRAQLADYKYSGYDRGHLAPAATIDFSEKSMQQSFLLSNIVPQNSSLNRGVWSSLESWVRECANEHDDLQIITGTIVNDSSATLNDNIKIPDSLYKIVVKPSSPAQSIAFLFSNNKPASSQLKDYITTIDEIERYTNLDFLDNVPVSFQNKLETFTSEVCEIANYSSEQETTITTTQTVAYEECSAPTDGGQSCCRTCKTGKACGDSCINKSYTCTKPKGCACNG